MHAICVCARGALSSLFEGKVLYDSLERERERELIRGGEAIWMQNAEKCKT